MIIDTINNTTVTFRMPDACWLIVAIGIRQHTAASVSPTLDIKNK